MSRFSHGSDRYYLQWGREYIYTKVLANGCFDLRQRNQTSTRTIVYFYVYTQVLVNGCFDLRQRNYTNTLLCSFCPSLFTRATDGDGRRSDGGAMVRRPSSSWGRPSSGAIYRPCVGVQTYLPNEMNPLMIPVRHDFDVACLHAAVPEAIDNALTTRWQR